MASFDENGKYIKTNWKAGDKITATKLNKIEESIEAVNDNDISRHVEADARLDALEAKDVAHDKEFTNVRNLIADNKAAAELGDYEINSRMTFLEDDVEQAVNDMNNAVTTIRNEMNAHTNTVNTNVDNKISAFETEFDAEVAGLKAVDAAIQNDVSEIQNDMTYAKMQSATVTDAYKFTVDDDEMMPSLVTLDNIMGSSEIKISNLNERKIVNTKIKSICTVDVNSKNYFEDAIWLRNTDGAEYTRDGNDITVFRLNNYQENPLAYAFISLDIPTLTEGKKYCLFCDEVIINDGASAVEIHSGGGVEYDTGQTLNSRDMDSSSFNKIFVYSANRFEFRLHCTVGSSTGNVTYKNMQIYEVKEIVVPDIQLNSLPNGVKDEIKDGMLIKRTGFVNLAELTWITSSTNANYPGSEFVVYYTHSVRDLRVDPNSWENELGYILCNNIPSVPSIATTSADCSNVTDNRLGISGHAERSEFRIKVYRADAPDLAALYTWLRNNNVCAVYELALPEYIPVNLNIKVDKGDTIVISTTKTIDLTYDIQLNTRAQIDVLQETVAHTVGSITSELRDNIDDLKYELGYDPFGNGYYTLPGGLMIQFGYMTYKANTYGETIDFIFAFPTPFPNQVISVMTSMSGGDNGWDSRVSGHATSNSHARIVIRGLNNTIDNTMFWFAIGR